MRHWYISKSLTVDAGSGQEDISLTTIQVFWFA